MKPKIDLTGLVFGRLTALSYASHLKKSNWLCLCSCGEKKLISGQNLRAGKARSCGCYKSEVMAAGMGRTHGMYKTKTHKSWDAMIQRCSSKNDPSYPRYGGAGIKVCEKWRTFENFFADMGERPEGKTLDRYPNPKGDYEPGNCRWATYRQQSNNMKTNRLHEFNGLLMTARQISDVTGINYNTLRSRLKMGWSVNDAAYLPIRRI